jgi:hypothetical protein
MSSNHAVEQRCRILGFLLMPVAFFVLTSLLTYSINDYPNSSLGAERVLNAGGVLGADAASLLYIYLGYSSYLVPAYIIFCGWNQWTNSSLRLLLEGLFVCVGLIVSTATTLSLLYSGTSVASFSFSGALGLRTGQLATSALGPMGALAASLLIFMTALAVPAMWTLRQLAVRNRTPSKSPDDDFQVQPLSRTTSV